MTRSDHDSNTAVICAKRYSGVIMSVMMSHITGVSIVCSTVCSGADQRKHQKLLVTGLCGFPSQRASMAENVSIWWRHHVSVWNAHHVCPPRLLRVESDLWPGCHVRVTAPRNNRILHFRTDLSSCLNSLPRRLPSRKHAMVVVSYNINLIVTYISSVTLLSNLVIKIWKIIL